jgi:hypothetical protein
MNRADNSAFLAQANARRLGVWDTLERHVFPPCDVPVRGFPLRRSIRVHSRGLVVGIEWCAKAAYGGNRNGCGAAEDGPGGG